MALRIERTARRAQSMARFVAVVGLLCLVFFEGACAREIGGPAAVKSLEMGKPAAELPPVAGADPLASAFLSNPLYEQWALSPDGQRIAAVRSHGDEDRIVVFTVDSLRAGSSPEPATLTVEKRVGDHGHGSSRVIDGLGWAADDLLVYSIQTPLRSDEDGVARPRHDRTASGVRPRPGVGARARKTRLHAVDLDGDERYLGKSWRHAATSQFQHDVVDYLLDDPDHILVHYEGRVSQVNVRNGSKLTIVRSPAVSDGVWHADHTGAIRAVEASTGVERRIALRARASSRDPWTLISEYDPYTESSHRFAGFSPDPNRILVLSDHEGDRVRLYEYDLGSAKLGPALAPEATAGADVVWASTSERDDRLLALAYCREQCDVEPIDRGFAEFWARIEADFPGRTVTLVSHDGSEQRWLVQVSSDVEPPSIHLIERATGQHVRVAEAWPQLAGRPLSPMRIVRYRNRAGRIIEGYLTRPIGSDGPGPLIVMPHDDAEGRDAWGYDSVAQYFAARGYVVMQPNYRGSAGYGRQFAREGYGEWGGAIVEDVVDAARALVASGIADPEQIGLFGEGFGGYLSLQALVNSPERFAAGASFGAVTDLERLIADDRRFMRRSAIDSLMIVPTLGGWGALREISPARNVDRIRAPILLGHGTEDPRYHVKHARKMERALAKAGRPHEVYRYVGATSIFLDDEDRIDFYTRVAAFFDRHLKNGNAVARATSSDADRQPPTATAPSEGSP